MSTMPTSLTLKCTLWRTISINGAENQLGIIFLSSGFLAFVHRIRERSRKIWKARRIEEVDDGWSPAQRILMAMPRIHPKSSKVSSALDDDAVAKKSFFWQEKNSLYLCNSSSKRAWVRIIISNAYCHISLPNSKGNHYREGLKSHLPVNYACKFTIFCGGKEGSKKKREK